MLNKEDGYPMITQVDPPDFLLTRIRSKLEQIQRDKLSWKRVVVGFATVVSVIVLNVWVFSSQEEHRPASLVADESSLIYES